MKQLWGVKIERCAHFPPFLLKKKREEEDRASGETFSLFSRHQRKSSSILICFWRFFPQICLAIRPSKRDFLMISHPIIFQSRMLVISNHKIRVIHQNMLVSLHSCLFFVLKQIIWVLKIQKDRAPHCTLSFLTIC